MATNVEIPTLSAEAIPERQSPTVEAMKRLLRHRSAQIGLVVLSLLILIAIFAPLIAPYSPTVPLEKNPAIGVDRRTPPCIHLFGCPATMEQHIMGIDGNFRDLFSRIIFGTRFSLQIGLETITFAILIGGLLGAIAGYAGGWIDNLIMRIMDVLMAFPSLLLAIAIVTVLGTGLINALLAIGIVSIPIYARLVRASILQIRDMDFVSASRALGASDMQLLFTRILPNSLTPLIVRGTLGIATAILDAAALSFLGLGAQAPTPEWGLMLGEEKSSVFNAPYLVFFPGLAIMIMVLAFNLLGDGLRDALDPRLRSKTS
jgi:ABC-type dipeptide/oligopeptide/nickel transport system permease subunit